MKECAVNRERAVVANHQVTEVAEPGEGTLDFPAPSVTSQRSSVLGHGFASIPTMRRDQLDPARRQPRSQRVTVVTTISNQAQRLLPRPPRVGSAAYADRRERCFREPRFVRGCRTKVLSQRKTLAVDHHHPLRALAPLGFSDSSAPFLAGAKFPSRKDSLHCSCFRSLSSARNARQILSQTPCSSQSRSLRQQVAGEGNSSGKSCQRAPLRRIHKMPSSTLRSEARGRPPRRREPGRGSKGRIFSHWASVNRRPYRAIGPPSALLSSFISHFRQLNYLRIQALHPVLKQPLGYAYASYCKVLCNMKWIPLGTTALPRGEHKLAQAPDPVGTGAACATGVWRKDAGKDAGATERGRENRIVSGRRRRPLWIFHFSIWPVWPSRRD